LRKNSNQKVQGKWPLWHSSNFVRM
jgi:hypothetical protein